MTRWAALLVCLAACHPGYAISVSLDVQCPSAVTIAIEVTTMPGGETYSDFSGDATQLRRVVVVPPPSTVSIHVAAHALDGQHRVLATGTTDIAVAGSGLQQVTLPILCGTCATGCADVNLCCGTTCINPATDERNCGGCGRSHAITTSCASGSCRIDACDAGWLDCDGMQANGCENDVSQPSTGCGAPCSTSHITSACAMNACAGTCEAGWKDCDRDMRSNGCEANLMIDPKNCGSCGNVCASLRCDAGACERRVFVSSNNYTGNLGGVSGADGTCQSLANAARLGGTYKAWLSTSTVSALMHLGPQRPGALTLADSLHTRIAVSFDALIAAQQPMTAIKLTELGTPHGAAGNAPIFCGTIAFPVWTNTVSNEQLLSGACSDWTSETGDLMSYVGDAEGLVTWSTQCAGSCAGTAGLYCFEQ